MDRDTEPNPIIREVTETIVTRSAGPRKAYLERIEAAQRNGPNRAHLTCGNQAHAYAAMGEDQAALAEGGAGNLGIITAYNDMLSAHQPFAAFPDLIKQAVREIGGTAQVAAGVPAMCDGVTQGQAGMELSLFSRDVIAMAAAVGLSHDCFDAAVFLGVCDKIVPGMAIAAASFGHLPAVFLPAGPMPSGLPNDEKARVRQAYAAGEVGRDALMAAEMASYHAPGTCTFYGTANSNQMLMEFMGLHLPGASFVPPNTPLREALTAAGARRALELSALGGDYTPVGHVLDERAFVNGMVGLMATGGSTNLLIHLPAMARAAGILLEWSDFAAISSVVPLLARVYPNGLADVNHFHAAGGLGFVIGELLAAGLLHSDTRTVAGTGLAAYTREPKLRDGVLGWEEGAREPGDRNILRTIDDPFQDQGGLAVLEGNLGRSVMKVSAVKPDRHVVEAPARVFHDQEAVREAFRNSQLEGDMVVVVRYQGPQANGMPELHGLTPILSVLQDRGQRVALVTDGRMSGASGKVPAAIHVTPEAADGGMIARIRDGDMLRVDATGGRLEALVSGLGERPLANADLTGNQFGIGRELFAAFRRSVGSAEAGASSIAQTISEGLS